MAFFSDQFLRDVLFFAVSGVSSVAILKIWENRESLLREIRRRFDSNETRQPEEHDERFDWEGRRYVSYENILSKSDRIMVIYAAQMHNPCSWLAVATVSLRVVNKALWTYVLFQPGDSQFEWLVLSVFYTQSLWCDLFRTRLVGRKVMGSNIPRYHVSDSDVTVSVFTVWFRDTCP